MIRAIFRQWLNGDPYPHYYSSYKGPKNIGKIGLHYEICKMVPRKGIVLVGYWDYTLNKFVGKEPSSYSEEEMIAGAVRLKP